jgi:hypothetical protein
MWPLLINSRLSDIEPSSPLNQNAPFVSARAVRGYTDVTSREHRLIGEDGEPNQRVSVCGEGIILEAPLKISHARRCEAAMG